MTHKQRRRLLAVVFAFVVTLSIVVPFTGSVVAQQQVGDSSIDTSIGVAQQHSDFGLDELQSERSDSLGQSPTQVQSEATIDPALKETKGKTRALLVLDQASIDQKAGRDEIIKTLKSHASSTQPSVTTAADDLQSVTVTNRFWIANIVSVVIDTDQTDVRSLAAIDGVKAVVKSRTLSTPTSSKTNDSVQSMDAQSAETNTTYGLDQINATEVWSEFDTRGEDTKVAVLDTGVDIDHPDLDLYTENASDPTYPGGWAEIDENGEPIPDSEPRDSAYHGTHVSGTIAGGDASGTAIGVAPDVQLMHGMVIPGGSGTSEQVIGGVQWAVGEGADVASLSLGAGCGLFGPVYSQAWIPVVENTKASGTSFVAAAGNSGEGCVGSPGNDFRTFSIGASNANGEIAEFSSGGVIDTSNWDNPPAAWPDTFVKPNVSAPGVDVLSAEPGGSYQTLSGTSMATPHVAGAVALVHSANPDLTVSEIQQALNKTAWKPDDWEEPTEQKDTRYGMGIIDVYNATEQVATVAPQFELGDVNENDAVNVEDVQLMQQYLYGEVPESFNENLADMNRDGAVTTEDLNLLQRKVQDTLSEGKIVVSNLSVPDEVSNDEMINVTVDLENPGDAGAIQEISLHAAENESDLGDSVPVANETVDMAPAGIDNPVDRPHETTVTFEIDTSEIGAGEYHLGVFSEDDSATDELTVLGANFEVSNLHAATEIEQGEAFDANATITNTGNSVGTQTVEYRFDGGVEQTTNVTLAPGESTTVVFEDIETDGVSAGTYEHSVGTDDDSMSATITVLEAFFDVEITDAPSEASVGETINVSASVENTGNATGEQTVTYDLMQDNTEVAVVDSEEGFGDQVVSTLREELSDRYNVTLVEDQNAMEAVNEYDTFVIQDLNPSELDVQAFVEATNGQQTGVVWLDGWGSGSDAIPELADATGNPASTNDADDGASPVYYTVTQDHPIFDGVAESGETVDIHTASYADRSWFSSYGGQAIATVGAQNTGQGGPALGVDAANSTVLASSLGREPFVENPDMTDAANKILANSVTHVSGSAGTTDVTQQNTSENVTLAPGDTESVEFTHTVGDDLDISADWLHTVSSEDDTATTPVTIDVDRGTVNGTVTDAVTDTPIEGATIDIEGDGNFTAVTGANGTYRIVDVPAVTHNVTVSADGYSTVTDSVDVPTNDTATVGFELTPMNGSMSGTVTASDTGDPVANVTVAAEDNDGTVYETKTDENGTYTLSVPSGNYVVNVLDTPSDYQPEQVVTVAPGEEITGVDFEITPRDGTITGTVTNAAGVPLAGANVVDADQGAFNVTTNESGHYEIEGLDRGTYALRAKADGYDASDITFVEVDANETSTQNLTLGTFFEVSNLSAPDTAVQGDTVNVSATITNIGEQQDTRTVFYFPPGTDFGGNMIDATSDLFKEVTLDGGESTTVTFSYQISEEREPGAYEHGISADEIKSTFITIAAAEDPDEANYSVSNLSAPTEAAPGEEIAVNATIANTGNATGTQDIAYVFNNTTENTTEMTLGPDENATVEFTYIVPDDERTYEHGIVSDDDQQLTNTTVQSGEPEPAYFAVSNLTSPSVASPGEEITVEATITNTGDEQGTQSIYYFFMEASTVSEYDLETFGTQEMLGNFQPSAVPQQVTLAGGESTTVEFTYQIAADAAPGDYESAVSTLQEVVTQPVTVTIANSSQQASIPPAPVFENTISPPAFHNGAPPAPVFAGERSDSSDGSNHRLPLSPSERARLI